MRHVTLTIPEIAFIAGTRGALGVGIGLLLSTKLSESRRRAVGLTLATLGAAATIPAAMRIFGPAEAGHYSRRFGSSERHVS